MREYRINTWCKLQGKKTKNKANRKQLMTQVQIPPCALAGFVLLCPVFSYSCKNKTGLSDDRLVGILNLVMFTVIIICFWPYLWVTVKTTGLSIVVLPLLKVMFLSFVNILSTLTYRLVSYTDTRMCETNRRTIKWIFRYRFPNLLTDFFDPSCSCLKVLCNKVLSWINIRFWLIIIWIPF